MNRRVSGAVSMRTTSVLRGLRGSSRGQALPVAVAALAIGALLITPMLSGAGGARASRISWE